MNIITNISIQAEDRVVLANKLERSRLFKVAEELSITAKELAKLATEVVGRHVGDAGRLTPGENLRLRKYLKQNYGELGVRYRKMRWS